MSFDLCNRLLKIWESIRNPTPKVGAHLGVWEFIPSHFLKLSGAWNVTPGLHSWPALLQALAWVTSSRLRLRHCNQLPCKWNFWKKKCHHIDNTVGHPTCIDIKNTNKGDVVTKVINILFFVDILGIWKMSLGKF
jgi:hypothetical protein